MKKWLYRTSYKANLVLCVCCDGFHISGHLWSFVGHWDVWPTVKSLSWRKGAIVFKLLWHTLSNSSSSTSLLMCCSTNLMLLYVLLWKFPWYLRLFKSTFNSKSRSNGKMLWGKWWFHRSFSPDSGVSLRVHRRLWFANLQREYVWFTHTALMASSPAPEAVVSETSPSRPSNVRHYISITAQKTEQMQYNMWDS